MTARFVASATKPDGLPELGLVENVGKSSLLGAVLGQPKLVRTSRTPGRTQALNLFVLDDVLAFVDLPGYGYAKLAKERRSELERMLRSYFETRRRPGGIVLLVDARRDEVSDLDQAFTGWVLRASLRLLVAVTKIDLVPKNRRGNVLKVIERGLGIPPGSALGCSSKTGEGVRQLVSSLFELRAEVEPAGAP